MKKERLASFKKRLVEKQRQLVDEVGRTALYGKDQEDDSIKDLGDQANTAYTREFFFELGNCERCGEPIGDKRLDALPFARHCIDCQRAVEQEERTAAS